MIRLCDPEIDDHAIESAVSVIRSGMLVQSKHVAEFEAALADFLGCPHVVVVSSGTAALHLALFAMSIGKNDEVLVPAFTFPATANVVELVGAKPVFVDISSDDYCLDPIEVERRINERTKAIMAVHQFGQPVDWTALSEISQRFSVPILEDAACAIGAEHQGKKVGGLGTLGCLSFHPRKCVTTGEGGAIIAHDDSIAANLRLLRNHGLKTTNEGTDVLMPGFNYRLTEFQAAIGLVQLRRLPESIAHRHNIARVYESELALAAGIHLPKDFTGRLQNYQTYHILLDDCIDRDALVQKLREENIETNFGAHAIPSLTYYRGKYELTPELFPKALFAHRQGLALPMGTHIQANDVRTVAKKQVSAIGNQ